VYTWISLRECCAGVASLLKLSTALKRDSILVLKCIFRLVVEPVEESIVVYCFEPISSFELMSLTAACPKAAGLPTLLICEIICVSTKQYFRGLPVDIALVGGMITYIMDCP